MTLVAPVVPAKVDWAPRTRVPVPPPVEEPANWSVASVPPIAPLTVSVLPLLEPMVPLKLGWLVELKLMLLLMVALFPLLPTFATRTPVPSKVIVPPPLKVPVLKLTRMGPEAVRFPIQVPPPAAALRLIVPLACARAIVPAEIAVVPE